MTDPTPGPVAPYTDPDEIDLLDILQVIAENLRLLILGPLAVGLAALGISFLITPTFTARTTFLPPQQQQSAAAGMLQSLGALSGIAGAAAGVKNPADQYVSFADSNSVKDALIDRFKLMERYEAEFRDDARKALSENARISAGRKDGLITIEVDDHDPKFAAELANAHIEELTKLLGRLAVTEAQERRVFFERELEKTKKGLVAAENALKATGVGESAVKTSPGASVGAVAALMAQVTAKEVQLSAMRGYLTDSAPDFKRAQAELAALRSQLARAEKDTGAHGGSDGDYVAKFRDFKFYETLFGLMMNQYEAARIDESREGAVIQVVDLALPPDRKSKPKKALIAVLVTLVSGFALLIFVFVRQVLRNGAQDPETARKLDNLQSALRRTVNRG